MLKRLLAPLLAAVIIFLPACSPKPLAPEKQRLLAYGASLAEKNGMGYEVIFDRDADFARKCKETLAVSWGITDADTAREVMQWLLDDGIRSYSEEYYNADEALDVAQSPDAAGEEAVSVLKEEIESYNECVSALKNGYGYTDDMLNGVTTVAAFDYDRLVTLARWCVKCKYLSEDELWGYAGAAALAAEQSYSGWEQYYAAVMLGKALTAGWSPDETAVADKLLKGENSPYEKYSFK